MNKDVVTNNTKIFLIPVIVAISSLLLVFFSLVYGWFGPADGVGGDFCEAARDALIKQPSNTLSNFSFVFFGLLAAWQLYKGRFSQNDNSLTRSQFMPLFFCSLAVLLGPGSMAMHASESHLGGYFDMLSMYLVCSLMFSYAVQRAFKMNSLYFILAFAFSLAVCHYFHFKSFAVPIVGFSGSFAFGIFIVTGMLTELYNKLVNKPSISFKWAIYCSLAFIVAFIIWQFGRNDHPWCDPHSLIQAHAIWHILNGVAVYFLFRLYVSEDRQPQATF